MDVISREEVIMFRLAMLCFVLWIAPLQAATVLVFGDSLSAGYGLKPGQGWVSLLEKRLPPKYKVVNASQSGETSAGGLARLPQALSRHHPDIVIL
ncbi:GDSL-type esterase/lipase family protein, partial [Craterilacuibacter sp.]|uniref:GDSL-type esterase/lipase family protein n=1 Tax=Craterilacuibacter sp. TaxID=2870909 RepID=UPI003F4028AA